MLFRRHRDNALKRRRLNEMTIYVNEEGEEIPQNLHDVKVKHVAMKMNQLFPNYMFWYSASKDGMVRIVGYRKGIIMPISFTRDELMLLYKWESVVPIEKKIDERFREYIGNCISIMKKCGEEEFIENMMFSIFTFGDSYKVECFSREVKDETDKEEQGNE